MLVELLAHTPNGEELIAQAYGICTGKRTIPLRNIPKWIEKGHLSPVEHASATFKISGISRACSHQLVRHRLASYSQRSQRYCAEEDWEPVIPGTIIEYGVTDDLLELVDAIKRTYKWYVEEVGIPKEDARMLLPNCTPTEIIVTMNLRSWLHFIDIRATKHAQLEICRVAEAVLARLYNLYPNVFGGLHDEIFG